MVQTLAETGAETQASSTGNVAHCERKSTHHLTPIPQLLFPTDDLMFKVEGNAFRS
jgi:hypothetical protein